MKKSIIGGAGLAAALGIARTVPVVDAVPIGQGYPQFGSRQPPSPPGSLVNGVGWFVWHDAGQANYAARNLYSGVDEFRNASPSAVINSAIGALDPADTAGAEILLSADINDATGVVTINRNSVSLVSTRKAGPRNSEGPVPHIQKIEYDGAVRGGLLQGIHCQELAFKGNGNQQQMALRDLSMGPTGLVNQQGLRFLGGAGYIQYINIHNLDINLTKASTSPIAVEFANSNIGSGHITFSGHVNIEVDGPLGSPVAFQFDPGVAIGGPIRIDNLSVIDFSAGSPVKTIYQQPQTATSQGLVEMNIGRLFFEQHNTSAQPYLVTIDAAGPSGFEWFILTIDELAIGTDALLRNNEFVVNIINNANQSWMAREQFLRVNSGYKMGKGNTPALGTPLQHTNFRVYLGKISGVTWTADGVVQGLTPAGLLSTPFQNSPLTRFVGMGGLSSTPEAGFDYIVGPTPIVVAATSTMTIKDPSGGVVKTVVSPPGEFVPVNYKVNFAAPATGVTIYGA